MAVYRVLLAKAQLAVLTLPGARDTDLYVIHHHRYTLPVSEILPSN